MRVVFGGCGMGSCTGPVRADKVGIPGMVTLYLLHQPENVILFLIGEVPPFFPYTEFATSFSVGNTTVTSPEFALKFLNQEKRERKRERAEREQRERAERERGERERERVEREKLDLRG